MKLLVVGDAGVGKSCFIERIAELGADGQYRLIFTSNDGIITEFEVVEIQSGQFELTPGENKVVAVAYLVDPFNRQSFKKVKEM